VNIETNKKEQLFQITLDDSSLNIEGNVIPYGRKLIGRSESCDIVISHPSVSAVHAVIEVSPRGIKIFDMNSKNGSHVNDKKVITADVAFGDKIRLGSASFKVSQYVPTPALPPILDTLEPEKGKASILPPVAPKISDAEDAPYIVYPLGADPKADYSEYIFEDVEELYPIFKYEHGKQAVEVIILFNDKVYSVDYLPEDNGVYSIVGSSPKKKEMEFAYLGKDEKIGFIEINNGNCVVNKLHNYNTQHLSNDQIIDVTEGRVNIQENDIVRLENGHLEIYIRRVFSPPKVKPAPFFRRDPALKRYVALILFFLLVPLGASMFLNIEKKIEEKDPERIARILYKKEVKKLPSIKKKVTEKPPTPKVATKKVTKSTPTPKPAPEKPKSKPKEVTKAPGTRSAPKVVVQKRVKKPAPKTNAKAAKKAGASKSRSKVAKQSRRSNTPSANTGAVDTYKSFDFKSTISSSMAKGGTLTGAKVAKASSSADFGSANIGGGVASNLRKADAGTEVGNLTGSTIGKLSQSKGAEGLSAKSGVYAAGIPSETVVLGSMDPDIIRRILRENIPQFRYCYQKELDRNANKDLSGTVKLIFTIGASGAVSKAGVGGSSSLPGSVKGCVVRVLRGISFPRPRGGGTVDVNQPFNFMPQRI
jgi:outer membrane biosynthesis protein TonB